jgi:hypothetical protein
MEVNKSFWVKTPGSERRDQCEGGGGSMNLDRYGLKLSEEDAKWQESPTG